MKKKRLRRLKLAVWKGVMKWGVWVLFLSGFLILCRYVLGRHFIQALCVLAFLVTAAVFLLKKDGDSATMKLAVVCSPLLLKILTALSGTWIGEQTDSLFRLVYSWLNLNPAAPPLNGEEQITLAASVALVLMMCFFGFFTKDRTGMGKHRGRDEMDEGERLKKRSFRDSNESFRTTLRHRLERLNDETNWNETTYVPVSALVEMTSLSSPGKRRRYDDLLKCLKKGRRGGEPTVYLVLGSPGAGKSVSLRKLCLELLDEAEETEKTPVYINLKQWGADRDGKSWTAEHLPDKHDLTEFVKKQLYENGDFSSDAFLDEYFQPMLENGRWYFIFDSFDEMPCLMSGDASCENIIHGISLVLYEFLTDTAKNGGVIASRLYHAPSDRLRAHITLRLQPFDNGRVREMIQKYLPNSKDVQETLFRDHFELLTLCRNPFHLALLISYVKDHNLQFPGKQMELYGSFVDSRLARCRRKMELMKTDAETIRAAAVTLADKMQNTPAHGLEYPVETLYGTAETSTYWQNAVDLLEYAKLCRVGKNENGGTMISFVHRRFQEYFLVKSWEAEEKTLTETDYECILYNTGLRDALVLYCETAKPEQGKKIAEYCWKAVQEGAEHRQALTPESVRMVYSLQFMAEAFPGRKSEALAGFAKKFQTLAKDVVHKDTHEIINQAFVQSMILFRPEDLPKFVLSVFEVGNRWLNDAVVQNCHILKQLDSDSTARFYQYFWNLTVFAFLRSYNNIRFSLSLQDCFRPVRWYHRCLLLRYASCIVSLPWLVRALYSIGRAVISFIQWFLHLLSLPEETSNAVFSTAAYNFTIKKIAEIDRSPQLYLLIIILIVILFRICSTRILLFSAHSSSIIDKWEFEKKYSEYPLVLRLFPIRYFHSFLFSAPAFTAFFGVFVYTGYNFWLIVLFLAVYKSTDILENAYFILKEARNISEYFHTLRFSKKARAEAMKFMFFLIGLYIGAFLLYHVIHPFQTEIISFISRASEQMEYFFELLKSYFLEKAEAINPIFHLSLLIFASFLCIITVIFIGCIARILYEAKQMLNGKTVHRQDLAIIAYLFCFFYESLALSYIHRLRQDKVSLCGDWPDNKFPVFLRERLSHVIASWDWECISDSNSGNHSSDAVPVLEEMIKKKYPLFSKIVPDGVFPSRK